MSYHIKVFSFCNKCLRSVHIERKILYFFVCQESIRKIMAMGVAAITAISAMSTAAFAVGDERDVIENAVIKTYEDEIGGKVTISCVPGINIELLDDTQAVMPLADAVLNYDMRTGVGSSTGNLDGTYEIRENFNTTSSTPLFSATKYRIYNNYLYPMIVPSEELTASFDLYQYNPSTGATSVVAYIDVDAITSSKIMRASNLNTSMRYYLRMVKTGGSRAKGYVSVS